MKKINYLLLVITLIFVGISVYLFNNWQKYRNQTLAPTRNNLAKILHDRATDPNRCEECIETVLIAELDKDEVITQLLPFSLNASIYCWDFTQDDSITPRHSGQRKKNFLIVDDSRGSGGFIDVRVFKNAKLIFIQESIYHGRAFFDNDNYLDIIQAVEGECNACPKSYILERYKYNPETETMEKVESREYPTTKMISEDGGHYWWNTELQEFIDNNRATFFNMRYR